MHCIHCVTHRTAVHCVSCHTQLRVEMMEDSRDPCVVGVAEIHFDNAPVSAVKLAGFAAHV